MGPQLASALGDIAAAALPRPLQTFTLRQRRGVTAREAQEAAKVALSSAVAKKWPVAVAVTDAGGNVRAMYVQEGANRGAADIALRARCLFGFPSLSCCYFSIFGLSLACVILGSVP